MLSVVTPHTARLDGGYVQQRVKAKPSVLRSLDTLPHSAFWPPCGMWLVWCASVSVALRFCLHHRMNDLGQDRFKQGKFVG
jgi:hypothetical protein